MTATKQAKILSVRLPEPELRRFKIVAAQRGLNLQEAVLQAVEAWMAGPADPPPDSLDTLRGSLNDFDFEKWRREEKELERTHEERMGLIE